MVVLLIFFRCFCRLVRVSLQIYFLRDVLSETIDEQGFWAAMIWAVLGTANFDRGDRWVNENVKAFARASNNAMSDWCTARRYSYKDDLFDEAERGHDRFFTAKISNNIACRFDEIHQD